MASNTNLTVSGGFDIPFKLVMSLGLMVSKAAMASSNMGMATFKSSSHSNFVRATFSASFVALFSSIRTTARFCSTMGFALSNRAMTLLVVACASFNMGVIRSICVFISVTSAEAKPNFCTPVSKRCFRSRTRSCSRFNNVTYNSKNSKNFAGITWWLLEPPRVEPWLPPAFFLVTSAASLACTCTINVVSTKDSNKISICSVFDLK